MENDRDILVALDRKFGRAWAKIEILLGLLAGGIGLSMNMREWTAKETDFVLAAAGLGLFVCGG